MKEPVEIVARASATLPATVDFLGGNADPAGSWVLRTSMDGHFRCEVAAMTRNCLIFILSGEHPVTLFWSPLRAFLQKQPNNTEIRARVFEEVSEPQVRELLSTLLIFCRETGWLPECGIEVHLTDSLGEPIPSSTGTGIRSTLLRALASLGRQSLSPSQIAELAFAVGVELNDQFVGISEAFVPDSIKSGSMLLLDPTGESAPGLVSLPRDSVVAVWESAPPDSEDSQREYVARAAMFAGRRILELELEQQIPHPARLLPSWFRAHAPRLLPLSMHGSAFLKNYGRTADLHTRVHAPVDYPVRDAIRFVMEENFRVRTVHALLQGWKSIPREELLGLVGEMLLQSHHSASQIGFGQAQADALVGKLELESRKAGTGIYGARAVAGSGGTVLVLLERAALDHLAKIAECHSGGKE